MKSVNLLSLINANKDLQETVFELYKDNFAIKIKDNELNDLELFVSNIFASTNKLIVFDEFFVGFTINQISKEFDLLRFGKNYIINIELKNETTNEKIQKQLNKNKYYLSFLGVEVYCFTFVAGINKLFILKDDGSIEETDLNYLITLLYKQELAYIEDVNKLFDPTNYLVSPFNSTEAFINNRYFLTDHQERIKNEIAKLCASPGNAYISIHGSAGTGKTLLTYDIAKEYISNSNKILIIHCGSLNSGQYLLKTAHKWPITSIKLYKDYDLKTYDIIFIDETQRIYTHQLDDILEEIKDNNTKIIFSYDSQQTLSSYEIRNNIPKYISKKLSPHEFRLTEKIRTNKEIASFIKNLFDLSKKNPNQNYENIDIQYFTDPEDAKKYIGYLDNKGWKVINFTPSRYHTYPYEKYQKNDEDNAHKVIGQEYDNVVAVIDRHFYYKDGKLNTWGYSTTPYYHPTKMLFQIVTRTRKKLSIIIINNERLLDQCLRILQNKV
ncbi:hypothetical protein A7K50_01305 [Dehalobacter sp. MCB1]|uniref:ATP-binding protein n=1 Tax=unclassified Dehalobacter TaxID=2635733 RepID=UPI000E6C7247|nr:MULTISPECIES: ATP-binding protein [unclassified Dehalobacter]RJE47908.1 hypothetical protein A7K50_01305 [Dehalobacter sp. MCB1]TCX56086.1 hypothetical protein C1I38_00785 [Dehalobacter sp. 12DCB1]